MKKVFMSLAVVAAMFAAASCACNNNSANAVECTECENCDQACEKAASCDETACCDSAKCAQCDSTCVDCNKAE